MIKVLGSRIQYKIIALTLFVVFGVTGYIAFVLIPRSQAYIQQETIQSQVRLASTYARDVNVYVDKVVQDLTVISRSVFSTRSYQLQRDSLRQFMEANPIFVEISHYNLNNERLLYMSRFNTAAPLSPSACAKIRSIADSKGRWISDLNRPTKGYPTIRIAVPVVDKEIINGFLMAEVNLLGISQMLKGAPLGQSGSITIVGPNKEFIAHSDASAVSENAVPEILTKFPSFATIAAEKSGGGEYSKENHPFIGSFSFVEDLEWAVLVQQSLDEAYAVPFQMRDQMMRGVVWGAAIMVFLGSLFAWTLVRPIRRLEAAMMRVKENDFNFHLKQSTNDEIGRLTTMFLSMTKSVREYRDALQSKNEQIAEINKGLDAEVKRQTQELAKALEIQKKLEIEAEIGNLVSTISHDVRNPVQCIVNHVDILKLKHEMKEEDTNYITEICKDIVLLLSDVLDFGKSRKGDFNPYSLPLLLDEACNLCAYKVGLHKIVKEVDPNLPTIMADRHGIIRIFQNLINNALEAMTDPGKVTIRASLKSKSEVLVEVEDTGQGIPESMLTMLFKEKITNKNSGNGLGMGVIAKFVKIHRGSIDVQSIVGKGTKFTIVLPINPEFAPDSNVPGGHHAAV